MSEQGWIVPTIARMERDEPRVDLRIVGGSAEIADRFVVTRIDAPTCDEALGDNAGSVCGLVRGHGGDHWACSLEFVAEAGAFALLRK